MLAYDPFSRSQERQPRIVFDLLLRGRTLLPGLLHKIMYFLGEFIILFRVMVTRLSGPDGTLEPRHQLAHDVPRGVRF
jgi:hypothetical protein